MSFVGIAVAFCVVALVSAPRRTAPDAFFDVGDPFFPDFTDAEMAATLEVVEWDEQTASAIPFEVTNRGGLWTIPSHHSYPADGEERLATAAANMINVVKDDFRSDNIADHEALGVIDPIDDMSTSLEGRGTRVTFKDPSEAVLAELILGNELLERPGFRFVRVPDQKRVYAARFDGAISTAFEDWIETNLLEVSRSQIDHLVLNEYFVDEGTRQVVRRGEFILDKVAEDNWTANRVPSGQEVDFVQVNLLVGAILDLKIAGVRPKPAGMTGNLRDAAIAGNITQSDIQALVGRGFFPTPDGGLLSNEGEVLVRTTEGVLYTLRFGEVVYGSGEAVAVGNETSDEAQPDTGENRYVFITAEFDQTSLSEPQASDTDAHASWQRRVQEGQDKAERLAARFADWYYVIAADSYDRIHKSRDEFLKDIDP
tara:strand:+ start:2419 stop:3699 length:1281 start_codon:yes stop_codon:yes gene_type:complete